MSTVVVGNELLIADHHHRVLLENYNNGTAVTDSNSHLPMGPASIEHPDMPNATEKLC